MTDTPIDNPFASIEQISQSLREGRITSVELIENSLKRIEIYNAKLHAYVNVYGDDARLAAEASDLLRKSGAALGPLHGVPIALKDLIEIEGKVTTGGAEIWRERVSTRTATLVTRARAAGMIVLGKTHTVEFAYGGWGTNAHRGTPRNPWDDNVQRIPGGSSSGSGVAVASAMAPVAIGTDTGGSVRLPAAFCGIVGLKTTVGRISTHGVLPLSRTLDTPGPMTRSVVDAALVFDALRGPDPADDKTLQQPNSDVMTTLRAGVAELRLAALPEAERAQVDPETLAAYDESLNVLRGLGAHVVEIALPRPLDGYRELSGTIMSAEGYAELAEVVEREDQPLDPHVRARLLAGRDIGSKEYIGALRERVIAKREFAAAMDCVDALLMPTTPMPAVALADVDENAVPAVFTRFANVMDMCALAVPNGYTADGLPTSLMINARGFDEAMALRIGWAYERATLQDRRLPPGYP